MASDRLGFVEAVAAMLRDPEIRHVVTTSRRKAEAVVARLSESEKFILQKIAGGYGHKQIASDLGVEAAELDRRRAELFTKLNAVSTPEAVRVAIYAGLG